MPDRTPWTLVYHGGTRRDTLPALTDEREACRFAESESFVLRSVVSLWHGVDLIGAFDAGVERDLTAAEFMQAVTGKAQ
jgi:hypothetical protein